MRHFILSVVCLTLIFVTAKAQSTKRVENITQAWFGYLNQTRFSNKWGTWTDLHLRMKEDFLSNVSVSIVRVGLTYYVSDATKLTAGYAFVNFFPGDNHKDISQPEHRPWQQVQWHTKYGRKNMMQWIRLEERFRRKILNDSTLASGSSFNWKVRYNIWYEVPLSKKPIAKGSLSFIVNDEVHVSFGKQIVNNYFDQNRLFVGFKYQTGKSTNLQFGYMNLFQQLAAGNQYKNIHSARFFFFQNLDLRKL